MPDHPSCLPSLGHRKRKCRANRTFCTLDSCCPPQAPRPFTPPRHVQKKRRFVALTSSFPGTALWSEREVRVLLLSPRVPDVNHAEAKTSPTEGNRRRHASARRGY